MKTQGLVRKTCWSWKIVVVDLHLVCYMVTTLENQEMLGKFDSCQRSAA